MNVVYDWGPSGVAAAFRPERVRIAASGRFSGTVERIERTGSDAYVHAATSNGLLVARVPARDAPAAGARVWLDVDDADICVYETASGRMLMR